MKYKNLTALKKNLIKSLQAYIKLKKNHAYMPISLNH